MLIFRYLMPQPVEELNKALKAHCKMDKLQAKIKKILLLSLATAT
jgi:hypothetical protein